MPQASTLRPIRSKFRELDLGGDLHRTSSYYWCIWCFYAKDKLISMHFKP